MEQEYERLRKYSTTDAAAENSEVFCDHHEFRCSEAQFEESLSHVHFPKVQTVSIVHSTPPNPEMAFFSNLVFYHILTLELIYG